MNPRSDVGGGGLLGALTILIMLVLSEAGEVYDFSAVSGAVAVLIVAGSAYASTRAKALAALVATPVGVVIASVIGILFFDATLDKAVVSSALAAIVVAAVTYLGPATDPDAT